MKNTNHNTRSSRTSAKSCNQQPSSPMSGAGPPDPPNGFAVLHERWPELTDAVRGPDVAAGSILTDSTPIGLDDGVLWVLVSKALHRDVLRDREKLITEQVAATVGVEVDGVRFLLPCDLKPEAHSSSGQPEKGTNSEEAPSVEYNELFGVPSLESDSDQGQGPPSPPPLQELVSEAEEDLYEAAFRAGYERADGLMQALHVVRKGLQRGKEVANGRGAHRE